MGSLLEMDQPGIADKIIRRAEVAKRARLLVDRLGLASFKTKHGLEHLSFDVIEPRIDQKLQQMKRSRPNSRGEVFSDTSSSMSDTQFPAEMVASSPLGAPIFSDEALDAGSRSSFRKRPITQPNFESSDPTLGPRKRPRSMSSALHSSRIPQNSWRERRPHTQSSPVYHRHNSRFPVSHGANLSFVSETTTIPDHHSPPHFGSGSDNDDNDLPMHSFQVSSQIRSSPPRTPPPSRRGPKSIFRKPSLRSPILSKSTPKPGEEAADLLMLIATSPSPATPTTKRGNLTPLQKFDGHFGDPKTPGSAFNYYDFVNFTPSPSQHPDFWRTPGRTPGMPGSAKTPGAMREARRKLNFDSLAPPTGGSPELSRLGGATPKGLGMELGGELVS
ncbi:MAG: hypothetical protein M1824_004227 [Vezdaea acicularis]|nr:MAG: hypothetical protein M1824_004227 [Vezdaea acicularis]